MGADSRNTPKTQGSKSRARSSRRFFFFLRMGTGLQNIHNHQSGTASSSPSWRLLKLPLKRERPQQEEDICVLLVFLLEKVGRGPETFTTMHSFVRRPTSAALIIIIRPPPPPSSLLPPYGPRLLPQAASSTPPRLLLLRLLLPHLFHHILLPLLHLRMRRRRRWQHRHSQRQWWRRDRQPPPPPPSRVAPKPTGSPSLPLNINIITKPPPRKTGGQSSPLTRSHSRRGGMGGYLLRLG